MPTAAFKADTKGATMHAIFSGISELLVILFRFYISFPFPNATTYAAFPPRTMLIAKVVTIIFR